ncbi:MAG: hypothetical protein JKY17_03960 [Magnetovibrio sp.]|nr:hypothetical protein [Magnetovibrio sp.]
MMKALLEGALNTELCDHLGYEKDDANGYGSKRLLDDDGEMALSVHPNRNVSFKPPIVKKVSDVLIALDSGDVRDQKPERERCLYRGPRWSVQTCIVHMILHSFND